VLDPYGGAAHEDYVDGSLMNTGIAGPCWCWGAMVQDWCWCLVGQGP
jgi:hypothetical protein